MQQHEDAMQRSAQEPTLEKTRSKPRVKLTDERPGARFRRNARKIEIVDHGTELMNGRKRRCVDYQELDSRVIAYFGGSGTPISAEVEHRFRRKWNIDFGKWNTDFGMWNSHSGGSGTRFRGRERSSVA